MESISQRAQNNKRKQKYNIKEDIAFLRSQMNSGKFCKLFDEGDISDYGSSSEADCALCALIAFRTGPDPAQIDAVYRHSALYRDKWERDDSRSRHDHLQRQRLCQSHGEKQQQRNTAEPRRSAL